jgi:hypothetical protein
VKLRDEQRLPAHLSSSIAEADGIWQIDQEGIDRLDPGMHAHDQAAMSLNPIEHSLDTGWRTGSLASISIPWRGFDICAIS